MRDVAEFILQLHTTGSEPGEIETLTSSLFTVAECFLNKAIHAAMTFVFAIGQNHKTAT